MKNLNKIMIITCLLITAILSASQKIYAQGPYTINVYGNVGGSITPGVDQVVLHGDSCSFTIRANNGFYIDFIAIDAVPDYSFHGLDSATYVFKNVIDSHPIQPAFRKYNYQINLSANPAGGGIVDGAGYYDYNDEVTVSAGANEGYKFINWTEGNTIVSPNSIYPFLAAGARSLTANFIKTDYWKQNGEDIYYNGGNVGIGAETPGHELTVNGKIHAEEVIVNLSIPQPDYVFDEDYNLMPLDELECYVQTNKHLPGIPSAADVKENGLNAGEMQAKLLEKVEELTLYAIDLKKQNTELKRLLEELKR